MNPRKMLLVQQDCKKPKCDSTWFSRLNALKKGQIFGYGTATSQHGHDTERDYLKYLGLTQLLHQYQIMSHL